MSAIANSHMQSAITPLIKQAVIQTNYIFFYLYPHKFFLTVDRQNLVVVKERPWNWKLIPWILSQIFIIGIAGWGSCVYVATRQLLDIPFAPWLNVNFFNTIIIIALGICAAGHHICFLVIFKNPQLRLAINELFKLEHRCIAHIPAERSIEHAQAKDHVGMLLSSFIVTSSLGPPFIALVAVGTNLDPFYFIIEEFLPHPYYRTLGMIYGSFLVRIALSFICVAEFLRFATLAIFMIVLLAFLLVSLMKLLSKVFKERCLLFYIQLHVIMATLASQANSAVWALLTFDQLATILCLWLVFKCLKYLPESVIAVASIVALYLLLFSAVLLPAAAKIPSQSNTLIRTKRQLHYSRNLTANTKYYYFTLWKSQRPIFFKCGSFFIVQRGVTMMYMRELINNLVNAVILIQPMSM